MPTGYTAAVVDGTITELEPFVLQLARGMGALITMRDAPWDAPIPDKLEPSTYNAERLAEAQAERDRLYALTSEEANAEADREHAQFIAERSEAKAQHQAQRERYLAMLAKVRAWEGAPEGIKEFAIDQLQRGLEFDCGDPFTFWRDEPPIDGAEWKAGKLAQVARDIEYHAAEDAKERARTDSRNAWLAQLRKSLTPAT